MSLIISYEPSIYGGNAGKGTWGRSVCVCERERGRENVSECVCERENVRVCARVCVCVCA